MEPYLTEPYDNLSTSERQALHELKTNHDIVIKKADKGGSMVIMNTTDYKDNLVLKGHLNCNSYRRIDESCDKKVMKNIVEHVQKHKTCLTNKEIDFLTKFEWKTSNFYVLPKIHKCKTIIEEVKINENDYIEIPFPEDIKGRPIVAGCNAPTQRLSALLEKILSPIVCKVKTYVKDDWHFLRLLPHHLDYSK